MPVLDHCSEAVQDVIEFESFHHHFATQIAVDLNRILPRGFRARAKVHIGPIEVDIRADAAEGASETFLPYTPQKPEIISTAYYPDDGFEVLVNYISRRREITVGAIEIVSRRNKDRSAARDYFVAKCSNLLQAQVSLIIIDLLRLPAFNLHNQLLENLQIPEGELETDEKPLYCCAYRPYLLEAPKLEVWTYPFNVGEPLPQPPLFLTTEYAVPVELEQSYLNTYRGLKLDEDLEMPSAAT
jgi:hypothetical protein